jgi:hypothetical protein
VTDARGKALVETCIALALFVAAAVWGTWYWNRSLEAGHPPFFYQSYFEPAVMVACGKGFVVARPQIAAMTGFLSQQTDGFVCGAIPPDAKLGTEDLYQGPWRYLMVTVGVAWRVLGISWSGMGPLFGVLFAATIVAAYGIFRLGMGRSLALLCACGLCLSPLHLLNLPHLRDYAKAPFTLLLILLLGLLVTRRPAWRNVLAIAAGYGVVLGIGYGFRTDFLANIPAFFLVLFVFLEGGPLRNLGLKGAAAAVCASAFLLTAWPIISVVYRSGGCQWHTVLLGLSPDYSDALGLDQPAYEWTTTATDEFVYATVTSYARRTQPGVGHIAYCQHEYDVATGRYLTDIVRHFPADMLIRGYASALHIVQLPFGWRKPPLPNTAKALYAIRRTILEWTRGSGLILVALAIGLTMVDNVRLGLFLVFFVLYFGSYPALQFANRHFFHLEFVTWWAAGFLIHLALTKGPLLIRGGARDAVKPGAFRRAAVGLAAVASVLVVTLWMLRAYQELTLRPLLHRYVGAEKDEVSSRRVPQGGFVPIASAAAATDPETAELLEVNLNLPRCGDTASVTFRYDKALRHDFSRTFTLRDHAGSEGPTRIIVPVYRGFQGLELPDAAPGCIGGAYRVRRPDQFRLMLIGILPPNWERARLYQRFRDWTLVPAN